MTNFLHTGLLLSALFATPALAQLAPSVENRIVVRTVDLDLNAAAGKRQLDRRLAHAVAKACGGASVADLAGTNAVRRCRVETSARVYLQRERLTALAGRAGPIVIAAR